MFGVPIIEWVGYAASLLVAISLLMKDMMKLRVINTIGSGVFVAYGIIIKAYPVAAMNFMIVIINIYYIFKLSSNKNKL